MMPCILIGDSIAVGVGQARPECETVAQVGISSERYISTMLPPGRTKAETAIISLGVNDDISLDTLGNLRAVRARVAAQRVIWLLPGLKENVRSMIRTVASENGDRTLDTRPQVGRDHLHPNGAGYEIIAAQTVGPASGVEVAYAPADTEEVDRPLRRASTPRDRIRRLRAIRHAEITRTVPRTSRAVPHNARTEKAVPAQRVSSTRPLPAPPMQVPPMQSRAAGRTKVTANCAPSVRGCGTKPHTIRS